MKKLRLMFRWTFVFVLLGMLHVHANVYPQNGQQVTLSMKAASLKDVLWAIERQTSFVFMYNEEDLDKIGKVDVDVQGDDIRTILNVCLKGTTLTYVLQDNVIVLKPTIPQKTVKEVLLKGKVVDEKKEPLPGVTILVKGTSVGAVTDANGQFAMRVPETANLALVFSFIGMEPKEVAYKGQQEFYVVMKTAKEELEEVVVTGYMKLKKESFTGNTTTVNKDQLLKTNNKNVIAALQAFEPSFRIKDNKLFGSDPNSLPEFTIRGEGSIGMNRGLEMEKARRSQRTSLKDNPNLPIFIMDGFEVSVQKVYDMDINRIESMTILKDAAATALYGAKAANGVIVVTTKKGHVGAPIVNYNMTTTFRQRPRYTDRKINLMNSRERIQFSRELFDNHYRYDYNANMVGYEGALLELYSGKINDKQFAEKVAKLETMNTDWFDLLTQDTWSHQHTLSISGGSEQTRYYSSLGYTRDNDVIKGNYNERYTAAMNLETTFNKWFTAELQFQGNLSKKKYNQDEISYNSSRAIPAFDEAGEYAYYLKYNSAGYNHYLNYNILNELENSYSKQNASSITVNTNLNFRFTDWLNAQAILSYTNSNTEIEGYWGPETWHAAGLRQSNYGDKETPSYSLLPFGGELSQNQTRQNSYTVRLQANLNKYFGTNEQHNISASGGFEMSSSHYNGLSAVYRGYYPDRGKMFVNNINAEEWPDYAAWAANNTPTIKDDLSNMVSGYLTLAYSYYNYFTLNVNGRTDGSNRFGDKSNDKFLPIWSVSGNYNLSEHSFIKQRNWLNYLSLKASFGYQGNMLSSVSPVLLMKKNPLDPYYGEMTATVDQIPNPNLKWEKTKSFNTGLTFILLDKRISVETEYYYKRTKDAFMTKEVASMNGVDSYAINGGDIENKGFGVDVTLNPIRTKDWHWTLSTSFSKDYNKVKNDPDAQTYDYLDFLNGTVVVKNKAVNTFYSYKFVGLSPLSGGPVFDDYKEYQHKLDGLSKYDTFRKVLTASGRREPYMSGSLTTNLRYKNIRLSGTFAYSLGAKVRLFQMYRSNLIAPESNLRRELLDRWQNPGDEKHTNIPVVIGQFEPYYHTYNEHWSQNSYYNVQPFASSLWKMYDYSDLRVVSGNYLKCNNLMVTYEFGERILSQLRMTRLALSLSGTNLFTISSKKLKGQTPTQGFTEVSLSDRPTYSFSLSVSF